MPYWRLFYHIVWGTKNRLNLITPEVEPLIYSFIRGKAVGLEGRVFALNGTADHIHLVAAIPPKIAVTKFIGQIKGVAATRFNKTSQWTIPLYWQAEYGVFSFDSKRLPDVITYVERQKEHHRCNTIIPALERSDDQQVSILHETASTYSLERKDWELEFEDH